MKVFYVTTQDQFNKAVNELNDIKKLCLDFETTGLDSHVGAGQNCICDRLI
jgi:hypothetical protein